MLSSPDRTSLRKLEKGLKEQGFTVRYAGYNSLTENPTNYINFMIDQSRQQGFTEVHVIGHSLGGLYVQQSTGYDQAYTVNSPFADAFGLDTGATHLKNTGDPFNILQAILDNSSWLETQFSKGGHGVSQEQMKVEDWIK